MTHSKPIMKWTVSPLIAVITLLGMSDFPTLGLLSVFFLHNSVLMFKF